MEAIARINIQLGDNGCTIQPVINCKETITNSLSLNISKSEDEIGQNNNDNGEISMQSIFFSEKKTLTLSVLNESIINQNNEAPSFKPDLSNKPLLKQLKFNAKNSNSFCSAISLNKNSAGISIKNTTISSKGTSITSFKNASNINMSTSPFNSNVSNKSNSHSYNSSFIEKGTFLSMNKIAQAQQVKSGSNGNSNGSSSNPMKKDYIETMITNIIKQRSLSSRGSRPTTSLLPASLSHRLLHITQANINRKAMRSYSQNSKKPIGSAKQSLSQAQLEKEEKRRLKYSSSLSSSVILNNSKGKDHCSKGTNYSLVNFILKNCLKKSSITSRSNKCQTSRSMINAPPHQKRQVSPNPPQFRAKANENTNRDPVIDEKKKGTGTKQIQIINNFSKYKRKSKTNCKPVETKPQAKQTKPKQQQHSSVQSNHPNIRFNQGDGFMIDNKRVYPHKFKKQPESSSE